MPNGATRAEEALVKKYKAFTGVAPARLHSLVNAVNYVDDCRLEGDIVECGVFRGANPMRVKELRRNRTPSRCITFEGMTQPTAADVRQDGQSASALLAGDAHEQISAYCSIDDVKRNFAACGLDLDGTKFIKGPVEQTLLEAANLPQKIAILRLDTDWYESTKAELEVLYPRLVPGGVLIIDDYGWWQGSRAAIDEYFGARRPLLNAVDAECRIAVKPYWRRFHTSDEKLAIPAGFEPATLCLEGRCSIQLSYGISCWPPISW